MNKLRIVIIFTLFVLWPLSLIAEEVRIYCKPEKVVFERKSESVPFTDDNKTFDVPSFVVNEDQIPRYRYREQLRCNAQGNALVIDEAIKTPRIIRQEALDIAKKEYDEELDQPEPDIVRLLRLQRDVELMKKGNESVLRKYVPQENGNRLK